MPSLTVTFCLVQLIFLGDLIFFFEEKGISSFWGRVKKGEGTGRTGTSRGRETVVGMKCMREE